ncbi:2-oxoacid:acceptor oxidoreductase subunit alpha [Sporosalibacterium faouarense]|uniref:2-oxoacid:acceptor oxidoreductase subunit alpha n=1 Tax=Sporosalibacterium faouarense TaxID=516123 RepID=UPI00192A9909|nr:2-oxoacid:acceptor oxidoreductase subunit alpha [Sporosalibacterium faouarense]
MKYNILVGGAAGQGMSTISTLLQKVLKRKGFYVFANKDYMSRVRGGHNFVQIRFGTTPITSHHPTLDAIIALDQSTIDNHINRLNNNGIIICDTDLNSEDKRVIQIPMRKLSREIKNPRVFGSIGIGALLKIFGISIDNIEPVLRKRFDKNTSQANLEAFKKGHELVESHFNINSNNEDNHIIINGNQAIALGAIAGGVTFYSAYPMTPSTSVMTYLSKKQQEAGILVEQAEDEIAAINMALGASYAGIRSMTGTSGGGFSLMVEGIGLGAVAEIPLVIVNVQRPGPATGLPTRTAQCDLDFVISASQDDFPKMVIAVRNPEDAFYQTVRALNLAEKYQIQVIILSDQYLADYNQTIKPYNFDEISIDRYLSSKDDIGEGFYKRYKFTENGISPRIIPSTIESKTVLGDSHEHNEIGFVDESIENRIAMMNKRMKRISLLKSEIQEPEYIGVENPEILLLGWGSTHGSLLEAVELLANESIKIGALIFGDIWPLPTGQLEYYGTNSKTIVNVEHNFTGQLANLIAQETGFKCDKSILRYDGRQLSGTDIYNKVKKEVL